MVVQASQIAASALRRAVDGGPAAPTLNRGGYGLRRSRGFGSRSGRGCASALTTRGSPAAMASHSGLHPIPPATPRRAPRTATRALGPAGRARVGFRGVTGDGMAQAQRHLSQRAQASARAPHGVREAISGRELDRRAAHLNGLARGQNDCGAQNPATGRRVGRTHCRAPSRRDEPAHGAAGLEPLHGPNQPVLPQAAAKIRKPYTGLHPRDEVERLDLLLRETSGRDHHGIRRRGHRAR